MFFFFFMLLRGTEAFRNLRKEGIRYLVPFDIYRFQMATYLSKIFTVNVKLVKQSTPNVSPTLYLSFLTSQWTIHVIKLELLLLLLWYCAHFHNVRVLPADFFLQNYGVISDNCFEILQQGLFKAISATG